MKIKEVINILKLYDQEEELYVKSSITYSDGGDIYQPALDIDIRYDREKTENIIVIV